MDEMEWRSLWWVNTRVFDSENDIQFLMLNLLMDLWWTVWRTLCHWSPGYTSEAVYEVWINGICSLNGNLLRCIWLLIAVLFLLPGCLWEEMDAILVKRQYYYMDGDLNDKPTAMRSRSMARSQSWTTVYKGPDRLLRMMFTAPITINPEN